MLRWALVLASLASNLAMGLDSAEPRVDAVARELVGRPYSFSPLGEGPSGRFDRDPRFRLDAFDCTTFVETVITLASLRDDSPALRAGVPSQDREARILERMDRIRYRAGAEPSFEARNHIPEADWIPHLSAIGLARDATSRIGGDRALEASTTVDRRAWYARLPAKTLQLGARAPASGTGALTELRAIGRAHVPTTTRINYIPIVDLLDPARGLLAQMPDAAVVSLVHPGHKLLVSHQGILTRHEGKLWLTHASPDSRRVVRVPFVDYLGRRARSGRKLGIHVLELAL